MNNSVAKVCKSFSVVIALLGGFGSFLLAYKTSGNYNTFSNDRIGTSLVDFLMNLIIYLMINFIIALVIYAIGEIIDQLTIMADKNHRIIELLEASKITGDKKTSDVGEFDNKSKDAWYCSKCGRWNKTYVGTCGCGQIKA
jgi:hypothetical protein